jgi:hypothetical protein
VNYWIKDTLNTAYGEADYLLPFGGGGGPSYRVGINDLDQRSVGADLIPCAPFNTADLCEGEHTVELRSQTGRFFKRLQARTGDKLSIDGVLKPEEKLALARQMYDSRQHTVAVIARTIGVSRASLYRYLAT